MRIASSVLILLVTSAPAFADAVPRLPGTSPKEAVLIQGLLDRSSTARALADELESTDLIVYVQLTGAEPADRAATRLVTATQSYRFLRVVIGIMTPPSERAVLLAHELQHVIEIGRSPEVRDIAGLRRLYRRIGEDHSAKFAFETSAAREIGMRVRRELLEAPKPTISSAGGASDTSPVIEAASVEETYMPALGARRSALGRTIGRGGGARQ